LRSFLEEFNRKRHWGATTSPRRDGVRALPLTIERNVAEQLAMDRELSAGWARVNADVDIQWLFSFHSADKKNPCGLYEAASAEAIREAARSLNATADGIVEVGQL
jgi:hypothetical protein